MTHSATMRKTVLSAIPSCSRLLRTGALCALIAGMAGSCSDSTRPSDATARVAQIVKAAGDSQVVLPETAVPVPPSVRLTDMDGDPVVGAHVLFTVAAGGGSVTGGDATTDSSGVATVGSWKLGATKGANRLTASVGDTLAVTFTATAAEYSPDITPRIRNPAVGTIAADSIRVMVAVTSRYELTSVGAAVGDTVAELSYSMKDALWMGVVNLHGLPRDTLQLVVTARDVNGAATDALLIFIHDQKPTLSVAGPDEGTVTRNSVDLSADCSDDDPAGCSSLVVVARYADSALAPPDTLLRGESRVASTMSLAAFDGHAVSLTFTAKDSRGQAVQASRTVYVESSAKLSGLVTVDGTVMDIRGNRVLYRDADRVIRLRDLTSSTTEALYADTYNDDEPGDGFITPSGAIFAAGAPSSPSAQLFEWRDGTLLNLGGTSGVRKLLVNGDYALFDYGPLTRRDLVTGTNTTITEDIVSAAWDVAPNGDVVFVRTDRYVYLYHNGTSTRLLPEGGALWWYSSPVTDGVNVAYTQFDKCCEYKIMLHDGAGETALTPVLSRRPVAGRDYAVNAGWTAFTLPGTSGVLQVWTRSPTGELRKVSAFGTESRISIVGSDGAVVFENAGRRYLATPVGTPQDVGSTLGTVLWRDGRFVVLVGSTAFAITP